MISFWQQIFRAGNFMPHGHCYFWQADVLWLHVISDALIGLAYFLIPYSLWQIVRQKPGLRFSWLLLLFGLFIFSCGTTHLFNIITVWNPLYRLDGLIKAITALASVGTAIALVRITPMLLAVPTRAQWEAVNQELQRSNLELGRLNAKLQRSNEELQILNEELNATNEELATTNDELSTANGIIEQQAEQLVRQSEEKLQQILQTIPDVVASFNPTLTQVYFLSPSAATLTGYPLDELYVRPQLLLAESGGEPIPVAVPAGGESTVITKEYKITTASGAEKWVALRLRPVAANGQGTRFDGIISDITERKQVAAELAKREKLLRSLVESQTNYLIRTDLEGKYTYVNQQFLAKFSFTRDELIGQLYFPTVVPEDHDKCQQMAITCITQPGAVVPLELRKFRNDTLYYTEWEFIGIQNELGQVIEIQGVGQDITERKRAEERLLQTTTHLQNILASITDAYFTLNTHWLFTDVNPAFERMVGLNRDQMLGQCIWEAFPEATGLAFYPQYHRALREQTTVHFEEYFAPLESWFEMSVYPYPEGLMVYSRPINDRKKAEAERVRLIEELTVKNRDLEQFAMITSHNLRAPVANLLGLVNIYNKAQPIDPINLTIIENLEKAVLKLDNVLHDLNDLLALRDQVNEQREWVPLAPLLSDIQQSLQGQIHESGAHIEADFSRVTEVYSIRSYVQSILLNLITNALKYRSPDRPPVINIQSYPEEGFICLSVQDNGLGIDLEKHQRKIFGLYKRFHNHKEGKGLGLYLVKTQAEALGGRVAVQSQVGVGTQFTVYLQSFT